MHPVVQMLNHTSGDVTDYSAQLLLCALPLPQPYPTSVSVTDSPCGGATVYMDVKHDANSANTNTWTKAQSSVLYFLKHDGL